MIQYRRTLKPCLYSSANRNAAWASLRERRRVAQGNSPAWKRFWQRFRSHDSKITQLSVQLLKLQIEDDALDPDLVTAADMLFGMDLQPRNASLYVDIGPDGEFRKPSDLDFAVPLPILWGVAIPALRVADQLGATVAELHSHLQRPPTESEQNTALRILEISMRRMRDAGMGKDEMLATMEKHMHSRGSGKGIDIG